MPRKAFDAEALVALDRIVRLDRFDHALHALHDVREIEFGARRAHAEFGRAPDVGKELRRADERFRRHATGVEAIAAHAVLFDERHLCFHGRGDVCGDQTRRARADHDQVAVEAPRLRPARIDLARFHRVENFLGGERKNSEQHEREHELPRDAELAELRAGVDVNDRAGEHAELAHPVEGPRAHRRETHREVDHEKREERDQAQREQIERAFLFDAGVDRFQLVAELRLHPVAQQEARSEKSERRADRGRERHDDRAPDEAENRAGDQRHDRRARQRQTGDRDVDQEEEERGAHGRGALRRRRSRRAAP